MNHRERSPQRAGRQAGGPGRLVASLAACATAALAIPSSFAAEGDRSLTFEHSVMLDRSQMQQRGARYTLRYDGAGEDGRIVFDPDRRSNVIVFRTGATPPGEPKDRAELTVPRRIREGETVDLGMRVLIPKGVALSNTWQTVTQCHQAVLPGRSPPMSVSLIYPDRLALVERTDRDTYRTVWEGPAPLARWFDLRLTLKRGEGGFARLRIDDVPVADAPGTFAWKGGAEDCSPKFGIYRGASPDPFEIRFDDVSLKAVP